VTAVRTRLLATASLGALAIRFLAGLLTVGLEGAPALTWSSVEDWYQHAGATGLAAATLWMAATATVAWVVIGSSLQLLATCTARPGVGLLADVLSPSFVRRLGRAGVTMATAAGLVVGPVVSAEADDPPGIATMEALDAEEGTTSVPLPSSPSRTVPTTTAPTTSLTTTAGTEAPGAPPPAPPPSVPSQPERAPTSASSGGRYVVAPGDCFWSIAERVLTDHAGVDVAERLLIEYWHRLILHNRGRLVAPDNPDLLYPGQVLLLPPS
jgi:hypothetical protein